MLVSGANNLYNNKTAVDDLNVFPVPDGDTGTNMSLTMSALADEAVQKEYSSLTKAADAMAFAALRGARGNSGVILSQLFRGMSKYLKGKESCTAKEFAIAMQEGANAAYKAVMKPTEGTILTVAREAATGAVLASDACDDLTDVLFAALDRGKRALEKTPEQLPALKKAGVVDAGGKGWTLILEGALEYLQNGECVEKITAGEEISKAAKKNDVPKNAQQTLKTENIKFKYCTEFLIEKKDADMSSDNFKNAISPKGDCMLVIDDNDIVKVHIHTNHPGFVIEEAIKLGELVNLKIDNMKHQHKSIIEQSPKSSKSEKSTAKAEKSAQKTAAKATKDAAKLEEIKKYGFVAVCAGKGLEKIFKDLGIDKVIQGGQTMNPSTDDILRAIKRIKAKTIFVFPNNSNIIMAANQAAELAEDKQVIVIPTKSAPQCISAMMAFNEKKKSADNEKFMIKAINSVKSGQVTYAVRDTTIDDKEIKENDIIGIAEGNITVVEKEIIDAAEKLCDALIDEDSEYITIYYGKDIKKAQADALVKRLEEKYIDDEIEISLKKGSQPIYYYIIGVE